MPTPTVRLAVTPGDYETAALLAREYVAQLPFVLDFQDFDGELQRLDTEYGAPNGATFLACDGDHPLGMAAVRRLSAGDVELKRMYLRPEARGSGLGRMLSRHAIAAARRMGASRLVLDTVVSAMPAANRLYESSGFTDIAAYCHNPLPDARFMALDLVASSPPAPVGVIAAGGRSSRMGTDKAGVEIDRITMAERICSALAGAGVEVAIVGGSTAGAKWALPDPAGVGGPVAALLAALRHFPGADVILVGTDQPYLRTETVRRLLGVEGTAVVPVDRRRQSLVAVYRHDCLPIVESLVTSTPAPSLQSVLDLVAATEVAEDEWAAWGEDGRSWLGVDTPQMLDAVRATWPDPPSAV